MNFKKKLTSLGLSIGLLFGTIGSVSAATFPSQPLLDELELIHDSLRADEKQSVKNARENISRLSKDDWINILGGIEGKLDFTGTDPEKLYALFADVAELTYSADGASLDQLRITYGDFIKQIGTNAGVTDLTVDDFVRFIFAIQTALNEQIASLKNSGQIDKVFSDPLFRNGIAVDALATVLKNKTLKLVEVFQKYYQISDALDIAAAITAFLNVNGVTEGSLKMTCAYLRVKEGISPNYCVSNSGGGGGGGTITPPAVGLDFSQLTKLLDELKAKIASATGAELQNVIDQAVSEATKSVNSLNNYDASMKTVVNGKVTVNVDGAKLLSNIENIAKIKKQLKELLDTAKAADQMPEMNLLVDIGSVPEAKVAFNVPKSVVDKAIAAGLDGVKLAFGSAKVIIPLGGAISDTLGFNVTMKGAKEANLVTDLKVLSQVFDLELTVGGNQLSEFAKPIRVAFPLKLEGNIDQELISVAKIIDDGKLQFHGGVFTGTEIVEPRDTLSSYVVVENKVSFSDIDSVQTWAGRQIQVIAAKGIAEGKVEGKFSPNDSVTRAEFAKMLIRALNLEDAFATSNFRDVKADDWFAPYAGAAVKHGIIQGKAGNLFAPNATITRAEMATMIARALKTTKKLQVVSNPDTVIGTFSDANQIHASLKLGVAFATSKGLVKGNAGKFNPTSNASRAEAAVILYRMFNYKE